MRFCSVEGGGEGLRLLHDMRDKTLSPLASLMVKG